ncbi:sperm-associated antigen 5 [Dendropsophus ebraccatus]|uniref:sperm-associated antigen 5 n=1 Tax=Dendropsophus ebraccatus TaxID=150705 RepID=UPI003831E40B
MNGASDPVHGKSFGRNPLKVLSNQHPAELDPNTLVNRRSSQTSSLTAVTSKESRFGAGTPVSIWTDPCDRENWTDISQVEASTLKKLPTCSNLEKVVSGESLTLSRENHDQFDQSSDTFALSQLTDVSESQPASSDNDSPTWQINVTDGLPRESYRMISQSSTVTPQKLQELKTIPALDEYTCQDKTFIIDQSQSKDAHLVHFPESSLNLSGSVISLFSENLDLKDHIRETQLPSGLPEILDPVVSNSEMSLPETLLEDSLADLVVSDLEMSLCRSQNCISWTPIVEVPTDHLLIGDCTQLNDPKWPSPIPDMVCQPASNTDQQNVIKNTPFTGSFSTPKLQSHLKVHEILLLGKDTFKNVTPRMLTSLHEVGTSMTPVSTSEGVTWTTPIMLLNKSLNTSGDVLGKGKRGAKDNASETDSVLWNFSREALRDSSREELMDRLEGTLIVVEVLSRQLQCWQQNVSSKPSEQRDCSTQTSVTYTNTDEQYYHDLYLNALHRLQSMQQSQECEDTLCQHLKVASEALTSYKKDASSVIEFAKNLYETTQKEGVDLEKDMSHCRKLLTQHMNILEKIRPKLQDTLLQRDEMRARMEEAIQAKEAADQCLQDLEIHSSAVISQLRQDLESERQLCEALKEAFEQQRSYNKELAEFARRASSVCTEEEENQNQMQKQCSQTRELVSRHWSLFEAMKQKTKLVLEEYEGIKMERDMAVLENDKIHSQLESKNSQMEQMKLEKSRLGSELELLMERVCTLQSEIEQLNEDHYELVEQLSAKDSSMKLLEKELNEATARGQLYQERYKHMTSQIVPSLKNDFSEALNQKQALQEQLKCFTESLEFLEQENKVCREQVSETESQLKIQNLTVLERNFQCENFKDTIQNLQKEVSDLQEKLSHSQESAQSRIMTLSKEISDSSMEVSKIKAHMLELVESMKTEATECQPGSQTLGQSLVLSKDEEITTNINAAEAEDQTEGIWSKTSAFTVVLPVTSLSADTSREKLPDVVRELSSIFADVATATSTAMNEKLRIIQDCKSEILCLREALERQRGQHMSEIHILQEELGNLQRRNSALDKKLNGNEKCISMLREVVNQQEQKILQQFNKVKESEVLTQENAALKLSLNVCEKEVEVLKQELAQDSTEAARNWIQEKLLLNKELTTLRLKLIDTEYTKSEAIQRLLRHKDILKSNLNLSETEVQKLDDIIVRTRQVLLSIPDVVNNCDELRQLLESLN